VVEGFANAADEIPAQDAQEQGSARGGRHATREARRAPSARWAWPAAVAGAAVILFLLYLRLSGTVPDNSDASDQALQAWDMLHGNLLLHGWTVGDVSYYTTEIPEYTLVELVRGLGAGVVHVSAAVSYTLLVLLAGLLAKGRATGRQGVLRALIASGILLAPQLGHGIHLLILQPDHIGTQVPLLVIFIVIDRAPRRWYVPVAVTAMLAWVILADRVAVLDAAIPLVIVCGLRAFWAYVRDGKPLASQRFELSLAAAGIVSFGASEVAIRVIKHLGGYIGLPLPVQHATLAVLPAHIGLSLDGIVIIYGADFLGLSSGLSVAIAVVHLAGLALALWAFLRAFRRFFSADLIVPVLAAGIVINVAAYVVSVEPATWFDTREILAVLPFGAVLAGRLLAGSLDRAWLRPTLAGVLACYALSLGHGAAQAQVNDSEYPVVAWLEAHHLSYGLGTYTESNLITLDSGGRVAVVTASWTSHGAVARAYESEASWYDPHLHYANFVVMNYADNPGRPGVSLVPPRDYLALAGPPAHTYHYKTFTILVWNHNLLADLGSRPSSSPGNIP
jgi:hypothetical protein